MTPPSSPKPEVLVLRVPHVSSSDKSTHTLSFLSIPSPCFSRLHGHQWYGVKIRTKPQATRAQTTPALHLGGLVHSGVAAMIASGVGQTKNMSPPTAVLVLPLLFDAQSDVEVLNCVEVTRACR